MIEIPGFRRLGGENPVVVVAEDFLEETLALGLASPGGLERLLSEAGSPVAGGRGDTRSVLLPASRRRLHVRPFAHGGFLRALTGRRLLGLTRPLAELDAAVRLRERDVPVPCPVFVIGRRRGPFWRVDLATVFLSDARSAADFLQRESDDATVTAVLQAAGRAVRRFHDAGGSHPDLHIGNLLVRDAQAGDRDVVVADLDRVALVRSLGAARRMAELMRLYRSLRKRRLLDRIGERGCRVFFRAYVGGDRELRAGLLARLPLERARVAVHAIGYPIRRSGR